MRKNVKIILGLGGVLLFLFAVWQIQSAQSGLQSIQTRAGDIPVKFIFPEEAKDGSRPIIFIGHGFSGSGVIMRGFAYTLAKAGYVTASWDFDGHGANPRPLPGGTTRGDLLNNVESVAEEAIRLGIADPNRQAILGHSMGSGVALSYGQKYPDTKATIAVSPTGVSVTQEYPHNLLLLAGENEPAFLENARQRLAEAGGEGGDPQLGTARKLLVIPIVEHVSIVFSPVAHHAAREWLDATFGSQPAAVDYTDRRIIWYAIGLVGILLAAILLIPPTEPTASSTPRPVWLRLLALVGGAIGATLILAALERLGINLSQSFNVIVGGYLIIWFALAGLLALLILNIRRGWSWLAWPGWKVILSGLLVALVLWIGVGLIGNQIWLPWLLIPQRLLLWPFALVCMLPWFLATGRSTGAANPWGRLGWWLVQTLSIIVGLILALVITEGLFTLTLILPIFPLILGLHAVAAGRQHNAWAFGLSAAIFTSWALLAVFPLG